MGGCKSVSSKLESLIEANMVEIRTKADMHRTCMELDATSAVVEQLRGELETTKAVVEKLGLRHDQTSKLIQGMSKGFEDTYRCVMTGESGMLCSPGGNKNLPV